MNPYHVKLTDSEMYMANQMATYQMNNAKKLGLIDMKVNPDGFGITLQGISAEIAFARIFNLNMSLDFDTHRHIDFYCDKGQTRIDVKSTKVGGDLIVPEWNHHHEIDMYALMNGSNDEWTYIGKTQKEHIINEEHWATFLPRPAYLMRRNDMNFILAGE